MRTCLNILLLTAVLAVSGERGLAQQVEKIKMSGLEKMIAGSDQPMVINFWATYCKPCIAEMPFFEKMAARYRDSGLKVVFVSLDMQDDYPAKVDSFVRKRKLNNTVLWLDETDADYFCPRVDSSWSGAIPATLFVNKRSRYRHFLEAELTETELEAEIKAVIR